MATKYEEISIKDFKRRLRARLGYTGVTFREEGANGWTPVDSIINGGPTGVSGPHWCDASFSPATQYLAGSYNFNSGIASFFIDGV